MPSKMCICSLDCRLWLGCLTMPSLCASAPPCPGTESRSTEITSKWNPFRYEDTSKRTPSFCSLFVGKVIDLLGYSWTILNHSPRCKISVSQNSIFMLDVNGNGTQTNFLEQFVYSLEFKIQEERIAKRRSDGFAWKANIFSPS